MSRVLIIKTGRTVKSLPASAGDFEDWIMRGMGLSGDDCLTVEVFQGGTLPDFGAVSGVVITGSAAMVTDLAPWSEYSAAYIQALVHTNIPVLGICYGHQLIAHALGGSVGFHPGGREIGTTRVSLTQGAASDPLFAGLPDLFPVNVSHSQSITMLPPGSVILASNGFESRHGVRFAANIWGIQFHPEFDAEVMQAYILDRANTLVEEGKDPDSLLRGVRETPDAVRVLSNFTGIINSR